MSTTSLTKLQSHLQKSSASSGLSLRERLDAQKRQGKDNILLLDTSYSMNDAIEGDCRKIDALWNIVQDLRSKGINFRTAEFNNNCQWTDNVTQPKPEGGTYLGIALQFIAEQCKPIQITLVTDGCPQDADQALEVAATLQCKINVLYVGPMDKWSFPAMDFCKRLADASGGRYSANSLASEVLQIEAQKTVAGLLTEGSTAQKKAIQL